MSRWAGRRRIAAAVSSVALCGAVLAATPARADVTVTPDRVVSGEAAKLTFRVTEDRKGAHTTKVEVLFPESAPIAEVWPLSVPDWAPAISMRKLDRPLDGLHYGQVTEVTSRITWTRVTSAKPAAAAELQVSIGPVPETDRLIFTVVQTYSDGTVVRWSQPPAAEGSQTENQAVVVTVTAPTAAPGTAANGAGSQPGAGHGAHGGGVPGAGDTGGSGGTTDPQATGNEGGGSGVGSLTTGLLIGLVIGGGVAVWLVRGRRGRGSEVAEVTPPEAAAATGAAAEADAAATEGPAGGSRGAWRLHE